MGAIDPDSFDRVAKLVLDSGEADDFEHAEALLRTFRAQVLADAETCGEAAGQAALLSAVNTGVRALHGGIAVQLGADAKCRVPLFRGQRLADVVRALGGHVVRAAEPAVATILLGTPEPPETGPAPCLWASARGWVASVSPTPPSVAGSASEVPGAVLAATIAVGEIFQWFLGHAVAGDRELAISIWDPRDPAAQGPALERLPNALWLLGLGHLGQAYGWLLGLLPYPPAPGTLVLQDADRLSPANRATSLLHRDDALGTPKTRVVASALERAGWVTTLIERRHRNGPMREPQDPTVLLGGVDNPEPRRLYDETGFPVICDAGLGAGPDGYLAMSLRRLPGARPSSELWRTPRRAAPAAPARAAAAYEALERSSGDRCGVEMLAGRTVATSFVGLTAACLTVGGLLREMHGGMRFDLIDLTLRDARRITAIPSGDQATARIASVGRTG
jgi:hypothetical protein